MNKTWLGILLQLHYILSIITADANVNNKLSVLVVGSINSDVIVPISRYPVSGETLVINDTVEDAGKVFPGGKGANQAVSCRRLGASTMFYSKISSDNNGVLLNQTLVDNDIDIESCSQSNKPSGLGIVFLQPNGETSSIVTSGANFDWPEVSQLYQEVHQLLQSKSIACVLLQMEIPQYVNEIVADIAAELRIPVIQDIGGRDCVVTSDHYSKCTYIAPNLTELKRLTKMNTDNEQDIIAAAQYLQQQGARNVLVTLGNEGSILLKEDGTILTQPCLDVDKVVDETGAGDNFRAGFAVARYIDRKSEKESLEFAAAAGAVSVTKLGAITSCGTRKECDLLLSNNKNKLKSLRGGFFRFSSAYGVSNHTSHNSTNPFPYKFASRLNSMKDRADLWSGKLDTVYDWIARQGTIEGLDLVDFNYPQHITTPYNSDTGKKLHKALSSAGLSCGAICLRFPADMRLGAYTHPDKEIQKRAIQLTKEACEWAKALNANEVIVWSAFDGYDYSFQVDYHQLWNDVVTAFQEVCDAYPTVKVSLEYKPTDENTRFFAVPSTGSAVLLMNEINRPNFGLTLDFGHCLMAGENPAQSVAAVNQQSSRKNDASDRSSWGWGNKKNHNTGGKLFGVQLGDGYGRLGAEDGLAFASVHSTAALEFIFWLIKTDYSGHIYFDTFPRNEDPVRECEYNIRKFKQLFWKAKRMLETKILPEDQSETTIETIMRRHDALAAVELIDQINEDDQ